MSATHTNSGRTLPPNTPLSTLIKAIHNDEDLSIDSQKFRDERIQAFYQDYAKRFATALTQCKNLGRAGSSLHSDDSARDRDKGPFTTSSPQELMELYAMLLRDSQDLEPQIREMLAEKPFPVSTFTMSQGEPIEHQFIHRPIRPPSMPRSMTCGCGMDHGDEAPLTFPDDSYEDEPDGDDFDDDDDDDDPDADPNLDDVDEDDEDYVDDDEDDEDIDDEDSDDYDVDYDQDVTDGYAHHYEGAGVDLMAEGGERLMMAEQQRIREEERQLKEQIRKRRLTERQKQKQEEGRIQLLQRLRLEDEARRTRELYERIQKERLEKEQRLKREIAEADQSARSFLFQKAAQSQVDIVKRMIDTAPGDSGSNNIPKFWTPGVTRLSGWEYVSAVEGVGEVSEEKGAQETLLHVAARVGSLQLAKFLIDKGASLDALDCEGRTPLHTASEQTAPFELCRLITEKASLHIDRTSIASGKTALHYAAQNGNTELVALLLQHHARVTLLDSKGNTPEMLAKAGLDRDKSSKAKAQKYRHTLQHLQKAIAAIKEVQRQKDAILEEQRRKEEELARAEAEKDKAARKKQEEKLEADLRRREEEEKELERLKALATDPHGHAGSGGNKKKKKKKGKGTQDSQVLPKESTLDTKTLAVPSAHVSKSPSPSPNISPAVQQPLGHSTATSKQSSHAASLPPASRSPVTTALSAPSASKSTTGNTPSTTNTPASEPVVVPKRLPKPRTSYRPSHLIVNRMVDMGFPQRDARKALIQTEGKVEEAIELLTSGAPLADDSEDEAQQAALEAVRRKSKQSMSVPQILPHSQVQQQASKQVQEPTPTTTKTLSRTLQPPNPPAPPASTPQAASSVQSPQQQKTTNSLQPTKAAANKVPVSHPIQILQRTHAMAPHVQMRSVPTQVLQRPGAHSHATPHVPSAMRKTVSNPARPPMSTPITHVPLSSTPGQPSLPPPRLIPPPPPTRAPYSYGASSQNSRSASLSRISSSSSLPMSRSVSSDSRQSRHLLDLLAAQGSPAQRERPTPSLTQGDTGFYSTFDAMPPAAGSTSTPGLGSSFTGASTFLTTDWGNASNTANLNVAGGMSPRSSFPPTHNAHSTFGLQHNPWGSPGSLAAPLLHQQSQSSMTGSLTESSMLGYGAGIGSNVMSRSAVSGIAFHLEKTTPHHRINSGRDTLELGLGPSSGEVIKDVLAKTGVIDSDEYVESLDLDRRPGATRASGTTQAGGEGSGPDFYSLSSTSPSAVAIGPKAVGQERNTTAASARHMASSLWGQDTFGGLISPLGQQLASPSGHEHSGLYMDPRGSLSQYSQWGSGRGYEHPTMLDTIRESYVGHSSEAPLGTNAGHSNHAFSKTERSGYGNGVGIGSQSQMPSGPRTNSATVGMPPPGLGQSNGNASMSNPATVGSILGGSNKMVDQAYEQSSEAAMMNMNMTLLQQLNGQDYRGSQPQQIPIRPGYSSQESDMGSISNSTKASVPIASHRPTGSRSSIGGGSAQAEDAQASALDQIISPGLQALNQALTFNRYPKLGQTSSTNNTSRPDVHATATATTSMYSSSNYPSSPTNDRW
ncbi:hypothetical protein BGW38_002294 [Lunasporangiospora selenospora]|uniref:UBA domain-containing protein n=1 Tax=Lunasporangiospora selenospora TaxID=979761 RepID=A0A9P6FUE1_9FUNG|nr:hypothetical protein BGW38_002294 [Lunasporangiospora selenospora]